MHSEVEPGRDDADMRYRLKTEELIGRISFSATKVDSLQTFITWVLEEIGRTMEFSRVSIVDLSPKNHLLRGKAQWVAEGVESTTEKWKSLPPLAPSTERTVFLEKKPFMFEDVRKHPSPIFREILQSGGTESVLGIPIYVNEGPQCILVFETVGRSRRWLDEDVRLMNIVAQIIGRVIEKVKIMTERDRIFDLSVDMIGVADFRGYFVQLNPAWQRTLGWTNEELTSKPYIEFVHPDDLESTIKAASNLTEGKEVLSFENRYLCKDGTYRFISWNSRSITEDELIYFVARDITERKIIEERLSQREEQYRLTVDLANEGIMSTDAGRVITFVNRKMAKMLGYRPEEMIGKSVDSLFDEKNRIEVKKKIDRREKEVTEEYEIELLKKDGESINAIVGASPIIDSNGAYQGAIAVITDITRQTEELSAAKRRVEYLIRNNPAILYTSKVGDNWPATFVGDNIKYMLGYQPEEFIQNPDFWISHIHPDDKGRILDGLPKLLEKGVHSHEYRFLRKDGSYIWILDELKLTYEEGKPIECLGAMLDISNRKNIENELMKSTAILSTQQEVSIDGILVVNEQGGIISFNHRFAEIWGVPDEILATQSDEKALGYVRDKLSDPEGFLARVKYLYEHREEKSQEEVDLKDGRVLDRYSAPMIGTDGTYFGRIWYFRDITDRKRTEEELRKHRHNLEQIIAERTIELRDSNRTLQEERDRAQHYLNDVRAIIVNLDRDGNITLINKRGCEILGRDESDILGRNWFDNFIPENIRAGVSGVFNGLMAGRIENTENYDNPILASDGSVRTISWHNVLLKDESGRITGTLSAGEDITERLKMEMDLKDATDNLTQINTSLIDAKLRSQTYFDFLAHDIANILSPIMAYAELMSKGEQYPPEVRSFTKKIVDQAQKATSLIHNLRKLEMLEEKDLPDMNIIDIKRVFSFVENSIRHKYPGKKPTFAYHLPEDIPIKSRGGEYIDFVIRHIFDNAVRHAQEDTVNIDVRIDKEGGDVGGAFWRISIEDDGPGIGDRMKKEITTPLDPAKRYSRGVASSLAFCSAAVVGIGGELQIEDRVPGDQSKGTRVIVWIPVYD